MKDNLNNIKIIDTKEERNKKITLKQFIKRGYVQIRCNKLKSIIFIIATLILTFIILNFRSWNLGIELLTENKIIELINNMFNLNIPLDILVPIASSLIYVILVLALAIPINNEKYEDILYKANFVNRAKQTSIFIRKYINKLNRKVVIWEFWANGIPYSYWLEHQENLESAIDDYYIKGIKKKGKRILVYLTKEEIDYSKPIYWKPEYKTNTDKKHFKVPIGINQFDEPIYWNTSIIPHAMSGRRDK